MKHTKILFLLRILCFTLLFAGCDKEEDPPYPAGVKLTGQEMSFYLLDYRGTDFPTENMYLFRQAPFTRSVTREFVFEGLVFEGIWYDAAGFPSEIKDWDIPEEGTRIKLTGKFVTRKKNQNFLNSAGKNSRPDPASSWGVYFKIEKIERLLK